MTCRSASALNKSVTLYLYMSDFIVVVYLRAQTVAIVIEFQCQMQVNMLCVCGVFFFLSLKAR